MLKQAIQDEKKEKQTQGFSRSLKSECRKIFVELESLEGKTVRKPESALASLLGGNRSEWQHSKCETEYVVPRGGQFSPQRMLDTFLFPPRRAEVTHQAQANVTNRKEATTLEPIREGSQSLCGKG